MTIQSFLTARVRYRDSGLYDDVLVYSTTRQVPDSGVFYLEGPEGILVIPVDRVASIQFMDSLQKETVTRRVLDDIAREDAAEKGMFHNKG